MLRGIRSRLTYANVMATGAMFIALGGGAYALGGIPDHSGTYHGCVNPKTGVLRVVANTSSCPKARTVRRGGRRVRIPGEAAIAWHQQGPAGAAGAPGKDGAPGATGAPGSALAFAHVKADGTLDAANSKNVLDVRPRCGAFAGCASPPPHGKAVDYCFALGFTPRNAVVSTDIESIESSARIGIPGQPYVDVAGGCAPGYTDAEIFTFDTKTGSAEYAGFYVTFN